MEIDIKTAEEIYNMITKELFLRRNLSDKKIRCDYPKLADIFLKPKYESRDGGIKVYKSFDELALFD